MYHYQCPECKIVNTDTKLRTDLVCEQGTGSDDGKTIYSCGTKTKRVPLVLLEKNPNGIDKIDEYVLANQPPPPPDRVRSHVKPILKIDPPNGVVCAVCGGGLPFQIPATANPDVSWRCSQACSLAVI